MKTETRQTQTGVAARIHSGSPRPTCVKRSYEFDQAQDHPDATRDRSKSGDALQIKHEYEFESDGPYTLRYYVPPTPELDYFRDELKQHRFVRSEPHVVSQHQRTQVEEGEIHTTELYVGDLFRIGDRDGVWEFVGVSAETKADHFNEILVFEPHDQEAKKSYNSNYLPDYIYKTKSDFGQKYAPFKDILAYGMGHVRIGALIEPTTDTGRPEVTETPNHKIAAPDYPDYDIGPMFKTGVQLKTYDTVPQSLQD